MHWKLWRCWVWLLCGVSDVCHKQKLVLKVWLAEAAASHCSWWHPATCFSMIIFCWF
jgi:hypothetical protein